jgi:transketolase
MPLKSDMDQLAINTIRMLVVDAVQKAKSGHPGTPMDAAPAAYTLWQRVLCYDPVDPGWINRDRFVLSAGHACMLLYSLIHLSGVKAANPTYEQIGRDAVTLDDIKAFRQAGSRCPGHPEYGWTSGVETTTGPLGQGAATSVGMAIARQWLSATYNRPGFDLFDFNVYALCGDGDMMEGIASEAASLAGHLRLANLCWIYDSNRVTIEGHTDIAFTEDVAARFMAYGWDVRRVTDANDMVMLEQAYRAFHQTQDRPTLIVVHSHIGYGAPTSRTRPRRVASHSARPKCGSPSSSSASIRTRTSWFPTACARNSPRRSVRAARNSARPGRRCRALSCRVSGPCRADRLHWRARTAVGWEAALPVFPPSASGLSTRDASGRC